MNDHINDPINIHMNVDQSARIQLRVVNCCLALTFDGCIESYVLLDNVKKTNSKKIRKRPRNRLFEKISENFCHHENVNHLAKIQYFEA